MTQTRSDLTANLAYALGINPDEIMKYQEYPDGYSVLTINFQKFTKVQPLAVPVAEDPPEDIPIESLYPQGMPEEMRLVYDFPYDAKVKQLRELAYFLDITDASALLKVALQEEIDASKKANA